MSNSEGVEAVRHQSGARQPNAGLIRRVYRQLFGNFGWPILLREMRADFRKNRFLLTQSLCLCLLGMIVLILVATAVDQPTQTPTQIGKRLFHMFFMGQCLVIFVIFPAFSSTTFTEERARSTLDLLVATALTPRDIVWGKFLSATFYCLLYVITSIPLMSIAFLFGGVSLEEVLVAYLLLIKATLLISMLGVCVSSCMGTSLRSTLAMYSLVLLPHLLLYFSGRFDGVLEDSENSIPRQVLDSVGWGRPSVYMFTSVYFMGFVVVFAGLFIITTNRIRPPADNKSTPLRVLTFLTAPFVLFTFVYYFAQSGADGGVTSILSMVFVVCFFVSLIFPTEEAYVSRRSRRAFALWTGLRYPLRVFAPGGFWGFVYAVGLTLLLCGGVYFGWLFRSESAAGGAGDDLMLASVFTLPLYFAALASGGFFLGSCDFSPLYARLTVTFVFIITLLLPVIFALSDQQDAIWTLYFLSPITLFWSLNPDPYDDSTIGYELFGIPVIHVAKLVFAALAIVFLWGGIVHVRRSGYSLLSFSGSRGELDQGVS